MQYIKGLDAFDGRNHTAVTLGKFDGLHRGHQKLLNRIMKYAQKEDCDSVVCAFDMDRDCLMTNEERRAFLVGQGRLSDRDSIYERNDGDGSREIY